MATPRRDSDAPPKKNKLCCCDPKARVRIETKSKAIYVENKTDYKKRLMSRADANVVQGVSADGSGGAQVDEGTLKDQGKIYRTDAYTVHWEAEGDGDLEVTLVLSRALTYVAEWLPSKGKITVTKNHLLLPPTYALPAEARLVATLTVRDCCGAVVTQTQEATLA
jgi:hypothetical protein